MSFAERLKHLKKETNHSAFAQKIGISEALLRKYLNGSDPSLSKAAQIAKRTGCSLAWLSGTEDTPFPSKQNTLDHLVLEQSIVCVNEVNREQKLELSPSQIAKLTTTSYQHIKSMTNHGHVSYDKAEAKYFVQHLSEIYI
ncbi:XRE family transcriptional regulator [Alteromonadaceae bacterium M269]|nr:XRE family transcriptional regulator [Alteromonadaceae bacterium M269]